jgi:uncharacterized protein (DUF2267 family)
MSHDSDPLSSAQHRAHEWLVAITDALGTTDRRYAYRVTRAWLHALRDRLTVDAAAHFGAQLPELWRGLYYEGWVPHRVPQRYRADECLDRVATEASVRRADAGEAIAGVSAGMRELLSRGMLEHTLDQLPRDVRDLFDATPRTASASATGGRPDGATTAP